MPRTVNMVTGPSRSADIEQTILLGAHGPRRLHILVVGDPQDDVLRFILDSSPRTTSDRLMVITR